MFYSKKEFEKAFTGLTGDKPVFKGTPDGITSELFNSKNDAGHLIMMGWFVNDGKRRISTLAHECSHAAFRICDMHGVKVKPRNNETHAYLLSEMIDCFIGDQ